MLLQIKYILLVIFSLFLFGCSSTKPIVVVQKELTTIVPPEALLSYKPLPPIPEGVYNDRDVSEFILRLYNNYKDNCNTIDELRLWIYKEQKRVEEFNKRQEEITKNQL
jgi:hypothetical protein